MKRLETSGLDRGTQSPSVLLFSCEGRKIPKACVLTLVLASQINLLWIPNFTEG